MKDKDVEMIIGNMMDAGCTAADADRVRRMHEAGMDEEIIRCLRS